MSIPVIAFFNNKGGVGKTSLVYHVSHMLADQDFRVLAADLDPQGNLSAAFLSDDRLEELWPENASRAAIYGAVDSIQRGVGDNQDPQLEPIANNLALLPGDMGLSDFEDDLAQAWPRCLDRDERAFRVITSFWRVLQAGGEQHRADVILIDLGPNLGAINRAALISADFVVIPLGPDLFSVQGLRSLGPRLRSWRTEWADRVPRNPAADLQLPSGAMQPMGYVVTQYSERKGYSIKSYNKWISRIPQAYGKYVLNDPTVMQGVAGDDNNCLALLRHYSSLMPMAREAGKPIFQLKPGDGALGAHMAAVQDAYKDFKALSLNMIRRAGIVE